MSGPIYSATFYENEGRGAAAGARVIVPLLMGLLHPRSVVDVGCGRGDFLREFARAGVASVLGIDGPWAASQFPDGGIPFIGADLREFVRMGPRDLCLCLETAEHIEEEYAENLMDTLTRAAPVVAFSAAVPGQGGTHHVNEQFPAYWQERFWKRGYLAFDVLRPSLLNDPSVPCYYAQSLILYGKHDAVPRTVPQHVDRLPFYVRDDWVPWMGRWLNRLPPRAREVVYRHYRRQWSRVGYKILRPGCRFGD